MAFFLMLRPGQLEDHRFLMLGNKGLARDLEARLAKHLRGCDGVTLRQLFDQLFILGSGSCHLLSPYSG